MFEPGEWECNQKLQAWRLKQADVESEGGKGGGGREQNKWEQLPGGQRNLLLMQHAPWESDQVDLEKNQQFF